MSGFRRFLTILIAGVLIVGAAMVIMGQGQQRQRGGGRIGNPDGPVPVLAAEARVADVPVYLEGVGTTLVVLVVLAGLGRVEKIVQSHSTRATLTIHARQGPTVVEDLETLVRRTGLDVVTISNRQENVDLVIELELRGSKRLYDQAIVTLLHHDHVRTVSTGE